MAAELHISPEGIETLEFLEGVRLKAYRDSRGIWTIGVGHTAAAGPPEPRSGMVITLEQCGEILRRDSDAVLAQVRKLVSVDLDQHQVDALVCLIFNIGQGGFRGSTVRKRLNAGDYHGAADAFLMWDKAGGRPILRHRREQERHLFLTGSYPVPTKEHLARMAGVRAGSAVRTRRDASF